MDNIDWQKIFEEELHIGATLINDRLKRNFRKRSTIGISRMNATYHYKIQWRVLSTPEIEAELLRSNYATTIVG